MLVLKKVKRITAVVGLIASVMTCSGCLPLIIGAAAGAGGVIWVKGEIINELEKPLYKVHRASVSTLKKMKLPIKKDVKDDLSAVLESELTDGRSVKIKMEYLTKKTTKISVRVGSFGNETKSREIFSKIVEQL